MSQHTLTANPYLEITGAFNTGRLRAILSGGPAVVLHRLAVTSKDGDWLLREEPEALAHVLGALEARSARYRFGAPLDVRWMKGGWSAHFEHLRDGLRLRTDFVTRPPRLSEADLRSSWTAVEGLDPPFLDARRLALVKMTDREKDWPVIGELARLISDPRDQLMFSRSPRDILRLLRDHPALQAEVIAARPALGAAKSGEERLGAALDAERRDLIRRNEARLAAYAAAARPWRDAWPEVERETRSLLLRKAHETIVARALSVLPFEVPRDA